MASAIQIPVSEYLESSYEYIDGALLKRNVGKWPHARVQWLLAVWFAKHESLWNVIGSTEQVSVLIPRPAVALSRLFAQLDTPSVP